MKLPRWREFKALPRLAASKQQAQCEVSLLIPARNASDSLRETVAQAHAFLSSRFKTYELILIPNPAPNSKDDPSIETSHALAKEYKNVRVVEHLEPPGKGAALRHGVFEARGEAIFFTDADLPYELEFFDEATKKLRAGYDLVTGNRRMPNSHFHVPVGVLPMAYSRHRLGLGFNRLVRCLLPVDTTDTQAGIKAMSRRLAQAAFRAQTCPGFFFDLEIFLTSKAMGFRQSEEPVSLFLRSEKSTVRIIRESVLAGYWLTRIWIQSLRGWYRRPQSC